MSGSSLPPGPPAAPQELLELATEAARRAGSLITTGREAVLTVSTKSTQTDVVTQMDTAAEQLITQVLLSARPGDAVLGEEGASSAGSSGVRWIVDPIDGTVNYLYGIPQFAVSVAAEVAGRVVAGVVYEPVREELFAAVREGGATCNGVPLRCSGESRLERALVATGFGYAAGRRARQAQVLQQVLPAVRDIRRAGAASLDLCSVASGRVDAYYERGLAPWDLAAGALVATESGARVEGLNGAPPGDELVIAAPAALFQALHQLLARTGADSDS